MNKIMIWGLMATLALCSCGSKSDKQAAQSASVDSVPAEKAAADAYAEDASEVPPVLVAYVKGKPLFAPFNDGSILDEGRVLKQSPGKYTKLLLGHQVFDVTYKEEKNASLKHDDSYLNQYFYQIKDEMKGQLYDYADPKAVEKFMQTYGDMDAEGHILPKEYTEAILVSPDYLKERQPIPYMPTTTEDPDGPEFPAATVAIVEKMLGQKVEKNRISCVLGKDEYNFGVMRTKPNSKYGIAAWVLAKGNDVSIWTDTCEVVPDEGRVYWSSYDPDEYMEPAVLTVVKSAKGLDIFTMHMSTDETANYYLMRQEDARMKQFCLGGFYQMYE